MREIDADAFINRIVFHTDFETDVKELFEDEINAEPTIEPRKKGKWINIREGNRADCDQCGQSGRAWMNFCFDCGADMREPEDIPMEYFESGGR